MFKPVANNGKYTSLILEYLKYSAEDLSWMYTDLGATGKEMDCDEIEFEAISEAYFLKLEWEEKDKA